MDLTAIPTEELEGMLAEQEPSASPDLSAYSDEELNAMLEKQAAPDGWRVEDGGRKTEDGRRRTEEPVSSPAADLIDFGKDNRPADLSNRPDWIEQEEKNLNTILHWEEADPNEQARMREEHTQAFARQMNENPVMKAQATASGASVAGKVSQALLNMSGAKDEFPTFLHAVQAVNDRGLAQGDSFKNRFFTETLPKLAVDSPLYMTLGYLTRGWGTFTTMNALEQSLDSLNTGKEFDEQQLKTSLLTDLLFRGTGVPAGAPAGGAGKRLLGEVGKIAKGTGILTGTQLFGKGLANEEITAKGTAQDLLENALLVSVMHVPQLMKSGQAGVIETAARKAGMPQADATLFANQIVNGKKVGAMRAVTDTLKGDESQIKQFAKAFRAEFGEAGLVNRAA